MLRGGAAEEIGVRVIVEVRAPRAVVEEPRSIAAGHALDEVLRVFAPLVVEEREHGDRDLFDLFEVAATWRVYEALVERDVLHPVGARLAVDHLGEEVRVAPLGVHVRHREEPVEVVEADVLRLARGVLAHVPLADGLRHVPGIRQQLRQHDLALQAARHPVHRRDQQAVPHRQPPGHDRGAGGRARRLAVARGEQQALPCELVDVRRGRADRDPAAVAAEVAPADVVHEDHQHVGPAPGACDELVELGGRPLLALGQHEARLAVRRGRFHRAGDRVDVRLRRCPGTWHEPDRTMTW